MHVPSYALWFASGFLFAVSFIFAWLWWCFIPAFVLLLYCIDREDSRTRLFLFGTLVGALQYGGAFFWVWSVFPILWLTDQAAWIQLSAVGFYWVVTSCAVGLGVSAFALFAKFFLRKNAFLILIVPLLWVCSEVLKSFLFSVYAFGPGSFISVGFSYGYLGYLLSEHGNLLQLAALGGVYALSYIAALIGVLAFVFFAQKRYMQKPYIVYAGVFAMLLLLPTVPIHRHQELGKEVIVVETYFDPQFLAREGSEAVKREETKKAVALALEEDPDVIIMPEDVRLSDAFATSEAVFAWIETHTHNPHTILIDNGPSTDARGFSVIRAYVYDLRTRSVYFLDKRYLVPQGEYLSYLHQGLLSLFMSSNHLDSVQAYTRMHAGMLGDSSALPEYLPGVLFCFETMVPYGVARAENFRQPDFIAHPISHAWFNNPFSLESQLDQMLKVGAVWNNVPIVTAASLSDSTLYLPSGEMRKGELLHEAPRWKLKQFIF